MGSLWHCFTHITSGCFVLLDDPSFTTGFASESMMPTAMAPAMRIPWRLWRPLGAALGGGFSPLFFLKDSKKSSNSDMIRISHNNSRRLLHHHHHDYDYDYDYYYYCSSTTTTTSYYYLLLLPPTTTSYYYLLLLLMIMTMRRRMIMIMIMTISTRTMLIIIIMIIMVAIMIIILMIMTATIPTFLWSLVMGY